MKFIRKILILCVIIVLACITRSNATEGKVTSNGVRIRKEPNTNSDIVSSLMESADVEVLEEVNGWYKIQYKSNNSVIEGYMKSDFIKLKDGETVPSSSVTKNTETPISESTPKAQEPESNSQQEQPKQEQPKANLIGDKKLTNNSKIYVIPSITASVKTTINKGAVVTVQEVAGNFAYVKCNGQTGWIRINNIEQQIEPSSDDNSQNINNTDTERKGYVAVTEAIVRSKATTSSDMVTSLKQNAEVTIIGEEGNFYKIRINDTEAYMAKSLISDSPKTSNRGTERKEISNIENVDNTEKVQDNTNSKSELVATSSAGEKIAEMAKKYIGYNYVYGGASPSTGFDCSGLVYYICNQLGYSVSRTATAQASNGVAVDKSELQPGDLVFFSDYQTHTGIGHVGIYIGDNQFVHASNYNVGVIISSLASNEYTVRYVCARRI